MGIAANKPLLELSESGKNSIQVVTSGSTQALVSDINGTVNVGDKITASPVSGIGMRAIHPSEIVGTAQANLSSVPTATRKVADTGGKETAIKVGMLPIAVNASYYSAVSPQGAISSFVPPFLQTIANAVAGRQVSPLRALLGGSAVLMGFITVLVILYVSIRSGVVSLGRNPLAAGALRKGLVDIIIAAVGVLIITIVAACGILLI